MEMSRLTGKTVADIKEHMIEFAKEYAIQHSCICILKDARTVVTDGQKVYINCTEMTECPQEAAVMCLLDLLQE